MGEKTTLALFNISLSSDRRLTEMTELPHSRHVFFVPVHCMCSTNNNLDGSHQSVSLSSIDTIYPSTH